MEIIGLFGKPNCGKTNTLNRVIDELLTLGAQIISSYPQNASRDLAIQDRNVCVEFRGKKVCIATGGDEGSILKDNCDFFLKNNADIAISATKTSGDTCIELNNLSQKVNGHNNIFWIKKLHPYYKNSAFRFPGERNFWDIDILSGMTDIYMQADCEIYSMLNEIDKIIVMKRIFFVI